LNPTLKEALADPESVTELHLSRPKKGWEIKKLPPLTTFPNLESVELWYADIAELPALAECRKLRALRIYFGKKLRTLEGIEGCGALEEIAIHAAPDLDLERDLARLEKLRGLRFVFLGKMARVPDALPRLRQVQRVELQDCEKIDWVDALTKVGSLPKLHHLKLLQRKRFELPDALDRVAQLRELYVGFTLRELPPSIGALTQLEELTLGDQLTTLPSEIGALSKLKVLRLPSNRLVRLPDAMTKLRSLELLDLMSNGDLAALPERIGDLRALQELQLAYTKVRLPPSIGELSKLRVLSAPADVEDLPPEVAKLRLEKVEGPAALKKLVGRVAPQKDDLVIGLERDDALPEDLGDPSKLRIFGPSAIVGDAPALSKMERLRDLSIEVRAVDWARVLDRIRSPIRSLKIESPMNGDARPFPSELTKLTTLEELTLQGPISELPSLAALAELRRLVVSAPLLAVPLLPPSIQNLRLWFADFDTLPPLPALRRFAVNAPLTSLPELDVDELELHSPAFEAPPAFGRVRTLSLSFNKKPLAPSALFAALPDTLEELTLQTDVKRAEIPDAIRRLTKLRRLEIAYKVTSVSSALTELTSLQYVSIKLERGDLKALLPKGRWRKTDRSGDSYVRS
jgi:Leucine-rich repeat (LRR) protein